MGLTIYSSSTDGKYGRIYFSDGGLGTSQEYRGYIQYHHYDDSLSIGTAASLRMTIDSVGKVGFGVAPLTNMVTGDLVLEGGSLVLKEITTPTPDANYGKIYTKVDNKFYVQTGDGVEHEIAETGHTHTPTGLDDTIYPEFANAIFVAPASDNDGQFTTGKDGTNNFYYEFTGNTADQTGEVWFSWKIPSDFSA